MLSQTEENYIKAIYASEALIKGNVSTSVLADKLATKASSVTDMLKKLADKKLINYQKYQGVSLTSNGRKIAVHIVRSHRLWEVFLVNKLNYNWDEVHELAEQLEHIQSDTLIDRLDVYLQSPTIDPHGDPIPDKNGVVTPHQNLMLANISENNSCIVVGVKDSSAAFLKFLDNFNIHLGSEITVLSKEDFDKSMTIFIGKEKISVSNKITENLFVKAT